MPTIIVGNKSDLEHLRKVEKDEVLKIIDKNDYLHLECSAKEGTNCQQVFENLLKKIIDKEANRKHRRPDSRTKCSKCGKKCRGKCTRKSEKNKENEYICMCNIFWSYIICSAIIIFLSLLFYSYFSQMLLIFLKLLLLRWLKAAEHLAIVSLFLDTELVI